MIRYLISLVTVLILSSGCSLGGSPEPTPPSPSESVQTQTHEEQLREIVDGETVYFRDVETELLVESAQMICYRFKNGEDWYAVSTDYMAAGMSGQNFGILGAAAIIVYCPEQRNVIP